MNLYEHPEAREELRSAAIWYESMNAGLGDRFLDAVWNTMQNILQWPKSAPVVRGSSAELPVRSMKVELFPYRVLYSTTKSTVIVLAYAHQKRRPGYWQTRIRS